MAAHSHVLGLALSKVKVQGNALPRKPGGCLALRGSTVVAGTLAPMHGLAMIAYVYKCMY
jgi:hypothetical protein